MSPAADRQTERAEMIAFCTSKEAEAETPAARAYWRAAREFSEAMVSALARETALGLTDDEVLVAISHATGSALLYGLSAGRVGGHIALADRLIAMVGRAARDAAAQLERIEAASVDESQPENR